MQTTTLAAISAIASMIGACAAGGGVVIAAYQIYKSSQIAKTTQGIDALLRLKDEWNSDAMQQKKKNAARLLWLNKPDEGTDVADVLDFFETVAVFINRKVIDPYLAWHTFYWWMVNFYAAARDYIDERRAREGPKQWRDLQDAMPTLLQLEKRSDFPSADEIRHFLHDEAEPLLTEYEKITGE